MQRETRQVERRVSGAIELRAEPEASGKPKRLVGYAALFNVQSEDLGGFREVLLPGAFDRALSESHDVRALLNHDSNIILGRTKAGTLRLSVDEKGLQAEIDIPETQAGRDTLTSVERGDLSQMSFAFWVKTDDWRMQDGFAIREVSDLDLLDVSVVAYPAYAQTEVHVAQRALDKVLEMKAAPPAQPAPEPGVPNEVNAARLKLATD